MYLLQGPVQLVGRGSWAGLSLFLVFLLRPRLLGGPQAKDVFDAGVRGKGPASLPSPTPIIFFLLTVLGKVAPPK